MIVTGGSTAQRKGLTSDEKRYYGSLFKSLDTKKTGLINGETARIILEKSGLSPLILGEIWQISDPNNLGHLTQTGFCISMRLIGYVQNGIKLSSHLADSRKFIIIIIYFVLLIHFLTHVFSWSIT